jgi:hypothetical protein
MKRQKRPKPQPVSTTAIYREIQEALKKIAVKSKKAPAKLKEELDLEMKCLKKCEQVLHDIFEC